MTVDAGLPAHKEELGMARYGKVLPARRPREEDDSILLRSAETIGRVIGTLQRQLDGARGRLSGFVVDEEIAGTDRNGSRPKPKAARKNGTAKARKATSTAKNMSAAKKTARPTRAKRAARPTAARKGAKR